MDENANKIDEVLAVYMQGPRSYTAEDVVEIQSHGGLQSLKTILALTYKLARVPPSRVSSLNGLFEWPHRPGAGRSRDGYHKIPQ